MPPPLQVGPSMTASFHPSSGAVDRQSGTHECRQQIFPRIQPSAMELDSERDAWTWPCVPKANCKPRLCYCSRRMISSRKHWQRTIERQTSWLSVIFTFTFIYTDEQTAYRLIKSFFRRAGMEGRDDKRGGEKEKYLFPFFNPQKLRGHWWWGETHTCINGFLHFVAIFSIFHLFPSEVRYALCWYLKPGLHTHFVLVQEQQ